jgi:hypothetical protein
LDLENKPEKPRYRRRPFNAEQFAMWLLAALIIVPCIALLIFTMRCAIWPDSQVCSRNWGFAAWLENTLPVIVAILMRGTSRPPPDE